MIVERNDFSNILKAPAVVVLENLFGPELAATELQIEHESYQLGEARFMKQFERQIESGQGADNQAVSPIMSVFLGRMVKRCEEWIEETAAKDGKKPHSLSAIRSVGAEKACAIALKTIFSSMVSVRGDGGQPATKLASSLGRALLDEARFGRLRDLEGKYFERHIEKALALRTDAAHKKAFLSAVESHIENLSAFEDWSVEKVISTGYKLMEIAIESCDLLQRVVTNAGTANEQINMHLHEEVIKKISTRAFTMAGFSPVRQPMVVPPKPWSDITGGGYWADGRRPTVFIRTGSKKALMRYAGVSMPQVYAAVNTIQNTAWKINQNVLKVLNVIKDMENPLVSDFPKFTKQELPVKPEDINENEISLKRWKKAAAMIYRKERARASRRISVESTIEQANKFAKFENIYFPHNLDWRGRVYAMSTFSPQGSDMVKGLLTLSEGKPIGSEGLYWLTVHTANCAGIDKVDFAERIKWVEDNKQNIINSVKSPLDYPWWAEQDSPFCFLAACFEMVAAWEQGESYVCSLPCAFDGSCSGIQHFSAMMRDEIGGAAVNLLPSDVVEDIYRIVADKVIIKMNEDLISGTPNSVKVITSNDGSIIERPVYGTKALAQMWNEYGVTRKVTKRSVMTLAYGSKEYGYRDQLLEDIINPAIDAGQVMFLDANQAAGYMAKLIWEAVTVTVVKAVEVMKWLQSAAKLLAAEVKDKNTGAVLKPRMATTWVTLDGFPVFQEYRKPEQKRLKLLFLGQFHIQPTINVGVKDIDQHKQETGIAPNFVHSMDGAHLRMTIMKAAEVYNIKSFAVIHDSFGTIPADAGALYRAVREAMVEAYEEHDVIADFYEQFADQLHESQLDKMPAVPERGNLDLKKILESKFAFA